MKGIKQRKGNSALRSLAKKHHLALSMNVLLVAATETEIAPTLEFLKLSPERNAPDSYINSKNNIEHLITGVGLMAATFALTKALSSGSYSFVIQAGIAGAFDKDIRLGKCVIIESEQLADLGAEDGEDFLDIFSLGFLGSEDVPYKSGKLINPLESSPFHTTHLAKKDGLTVLTASGLESTIEKRVHRYAASVESMEGAALHYVCLMMGVPFLQLRAISNYVTRRDRSAWEIGAAVRALNAQLADWLM